MRGLRRKTRRALATGGTGSVKKNWKQPKSHPAYSNKSYLVYKKFQFGKTPNPMPELREEDLLDAGLNQFVFGGGMRGQMFPQLNGFRVVGRNEASSKMPVIACGWPHAHHGQLVFFSKN
jgi:hypothetical protein